MATTIEKRNEWLKELRIAIRFVELANEYLEDGELMAAKGALLGAFMQLEKNQKSHSCGIKSLKGFCESI